MSAFHKTSAVRWVYSGVALLGCALAPLACSSTSDTSDGVGGAGGSADDGSADGSDGTPDIDYTKLPRGRARPGGAFVHLFEWKWTDVALECENFLGPHGFAGVQVSPSNAHAVLPNQPWYERYQPAGYELVSRSGTREEFADMVTRCDAVGVDIYVDAVINHMTAQTSGVNSAGQSYTKYEYDGLYGPDDFHQPACTIQGSDYANNAENVRHCELSGLADLKTEDDGVRDKIADYLADYVSLGVRGFRIDAAKHMEVADVAAIIQKVSDRVGKDKAPYFFLEVIDNGSEAIHATDYLDVAGDSGSVVDITEFKFQGTGEQFLYAEGGTAALYTLAELSEQNWDLLPTDRAVAFTNNHDTQRASEIYYQDGSFYDLANVFFLAYPYGFPQIMSSFAFSRANTAKGPPSDAQGNTDSIYVGDSKEPGCLAPGDLSTPSGWVCEHRTPQVYAMVEFRQAMAGQDVNHFWSNQANQIAFGRGDAGFVVINAESAELATTLDSNLPAGSYCDRLSGGRKGSACAGLLAQVGADGRVDVKVPASTALVIDQGSKLP